MTRARPAAAVAAAVALVGVGGCGDRKRDPAPATAEGTAAASATTRRASALIAGLRDGGDRARRAVADIANLSTRQALSTAEGEAILGAVPTLPAPEDATREGDLQAQVLRAIGDHLWLDWIPRMEELAAELREPGRLALLATLARHDTPETAAALARLIDRYPAPVPGEAFEHLRDELHQGAALFPSLLESAARHDALMQEVIATAVSYAEGGALPPGVLDDHRRRLLLRLDEDLAALDRVQRPTGVGWMFEEGYATRRWLAGALIDLAGAMPVEDAEPVLRRALRLRDPRLVMFAIESALDHGLTIPTASLAHACTSPQSAAYVWRLHEQRGLLPRLPAACRDQTVLAAGVLTEALWFGSDYDRAPDELELLERVSFDAGPPDGWLDVYVFRYRSGDEPWLAGAAGPFLRADGLTTKDRGGTATDLGPADEVVPQEVYTRDDVLKWWRERRAEEARAADAADAGAP